MTRFLPELGIEPIDSESKPSTSVTKFSLYPSRVWLVAGLNHRPVTEGHWHWSKEKLPSISMSYFKGVNTPDHSTLYANIQTHIQRHVTPYVAHLRPKSGTTTKSLMQSIASQLTSINKVSWCKRRVPVAEKYGHSSSITLQIPTKARNPFSVDSVSDTEWV